MNKTPHYLVIGAGIAGLSCAQLSHGAGFGVTVVDKSRGQAGCQCRFKIDTDHSRFRSDQQNFVVAGVFG